MKKNNFRFIYICPNKKCEGNIIFKSEKYQEAIAKIKCQKCGKLYSFDELIVKRLSMIGLK